MAVAATTAAATGDHDSLVELRGDVRNMAANNAENHKSLLAAVADVKLKVEAQNGRIGKLEQWRTQVTAIYGAILLAAPFVFYALSKWFGT